MSKYKFGIMHLPIQRYLKWWLDKRASIEEFIVGFSNKNPAYLINCLKASFISFKLGGRTVQDGTPTPENPIPIQNVEGKNKFDNEQNYNAYGGNAIIQEKLPTGIRIKQTSNSANYSFGAYVIKNLSNCVGKTVRMKTNFLASGNNKPRYYIGLGNSSGGNRTPMKDSTISGETISFVVPEIETGKEYLIVGLYATYNANGNVNDYVDFTDLIVTIDNEDMSYVPYNCIQIKKYNKNLFSPTGFEAGLVRGKIKNDSGTEINDSTSTYSTYTIPVKANEPISVYGWFQRVYFYDKNMNWIRRSPSGAQGVSVPMVDVFTPTVDGYIQFQIQNNGYNNNKGQEQVEYGSTHTSYVAHAEKTYNFPLSEGQKLMQDGTIENKVVNIRKQRIFDGTEDWYLDSTGNGFNRFILSCSDMKSGNDNPILCNYLTQVPASQTEVSTRNKECIASSSGSNYRIMLVLNSTDFPNKSALQSWLAEKYANGVPMIIEYLLEEPDETPFIEAQQEVIDEIINDGTYKEVTHIEATANINPDMEIEYKQKAGE